MDFSKLISLLQRSELFFTRLGHLADTADFYEGALSQLNYDRPEVESARILELLDPGITQEMREIRQRQFSDPDFLDQYVQLSRQIIYVNCWHENQYESAAMWRLYVQANEGIAIRSTIGQFKQSLRSPQGEEYLYRAHYYDPQRETVILDYWLIPLYKRISFEHEKEVRAFVVNPHPETVYPTVSKVGVYVPCDLDTLIDRVYVAPSAPDFVFEAVEELLRRFGVSKPVEHSSLDTPPGRAVK